MKAHASGAWTLALGAALLCAAGAADAQRHYRPHHGDWHHDWENRQDARRAGVLVGVVAAGAAGAAARSAADQRYADCLYVTGYDYACDRRRYYDEQRARSSALRAGVLAGVAAHAIVRD